MPVDIFWFPAIWLAAAAGGFLRYLDRGPKVLFFLQIDRSEKLSFEVENRQKIWTRRPVYT